MRELAFFGCIALLLLVCIAFVSLFTFTFSFYTNEENKRDEREVAYRIIIVAFIIITSAFIVYPESFGYEIVSESVIESEK